MTHPEAVEAVAEALHDAWCDCTVEIDIARFKRSSTVAVDALVAAGWAPRREAERDNDRKWCDIIDGAGERPDGVEFTPAVLDAIRAQERQAVAEEIAAAIEVAQRSKTATEIAAAIEAYPGARGPAIDDPRDPRRPGLDTARRIARDLGKAATT